MKFLTRKLVTPADLNPRGTLHGGQLLKWIDEEGGIHACLELDTGLIVTKYISEIDFDKPKNTPPKSAPNVEQPFAAAVNFESENSGQI